MNFSNHIEKFEWNKLLSNFVSNLIPLIKLYLSLIVMQQPFLSKLLPK